MSTSDLIAAPLLVLVVFLQLASALGVLVMRDAYQRIHFIALPCTLGVALLCVAVAVHEQAFAGAAKTCTVAVLLSLMNGVLSHATARATFVSDNGGDELGLPESES